jgi:4-hydroxy-tetrahydrodipicolinate reductase
MSERISIAIIGSRGRMGRALSHLIEGEFASSALIIGSIHSHSTDEDWAEALRADVWIDFSLPKSTSRLHGSLISASKGGRLPALVIGTTGHSAAERALLEELSLRTEILQASNFSPGVLALKKALEFISPVLSASGFRPLLVETHHIHKKDAPSGTALTLAAATSGLLPERIHSIRAGEVIGDHRIEFHGHGERITFEHHAQSREIFARGALEAALWLARRHRSDPDSSGWASLDDFFEEKRSCLK